MKCKVLLRVYLNHIYFKYLIGNKYLISVNYININLGIDGWVKNVESFRYNECG